MLERYAKFIRANYCNKRRKQMSSSKCFQNLNKLDPVFYSNNAC